MSNGEKGAWQGELFRDSTTLLLRMLDYDEIVAGDADFDFVGRAPPGGGRGILSKPYLSPSGVVGFEFTSQGSVSEQDVDDLNEKVNSASVQKKYGLNGGVLICDLRVPDRIYQHALSKGCYVWDVRDASLQALKAYLCKTILKYTIELPLLDSASYLWSLDERTRPGAARASAGILFQDPLAQLTWKNLEECLQQFTARAVEISTPMGIRRVEVSLTVYTRSYCTRDFYDKLDTVAAELSNPESIIVRPKGVVSLFVGPWAGVLTL